MARFPWDKEKELANANMMLAHHPYDEYKADENERKYLDGLYDKLKRNKEPGKDPADVFRDGIQGELFGRNPNRWTLANVAAGSKIINELPRGGWPARNSHRGLVDKEVLLDTMKRATAAFQQAQLPANNIRSLGVYRTKDRRLWDEVLQRFITDPWPGKQA